MRCTDESKTPSAMLSISGRLDLYHMVANRPYTSPAGNYWALRKPQVLVCKAWADNPIDIFKTAAKRRRRGSKGNASEMARRRDLYQS